MYRDAFRPSRPAYERPEPEIKPVTTVKDKSPVVDEQLVEQYVSKAEASPVFRHEPTDISPDTDAASSITMSDDDEPQPDAIVEDLILEKEITSPTEQDTQQDDDVQSEEESNTIIVKKEKMKTVYDL